MQEDEFPWIAAILREDAETADESECGGTLVSCLPKIYQKFGVLIYQMLIQKKLLFCLTLV